MSKNIHSVSTIIVTVQQNSLNNQLLFSFNQNKQYIKRSSLEITKILPFEISKIIIVEDIRKETFYLKCTCHRLPQGGGTPG